MKNNKLSIIVPVYNAEHYLHQCLDSIVSQTFQDIEILCVNDGSKDGSLAILESYAERDPRIRIFTKENEGLGGASARNYGLERATGEYILFLDSDDFFEPNMFERMIARAEETNADIVLCNGNEFDDKAKRKLNVIHILDYVLLPDQEVFSYLDCPDKIYQITQGYAWNKLLRRTFLDKHDLRFQRVKFTDDAYFTFSLMVLAKRIAVVNEKFINYRVNSGTSQSDGITRYPDSAYIPYVSLKESLLEWGIYESVKKSFVNCAAAFLRNCYDKLRTFEAYEYLHNVYRREIFSKLDVDQLPGEDFYDRRIYEWYCMVRDHEPGELAFQCARAYGCEHTTAILRFRFPSELVPHRSKIVLYGAGLVGRNYYVQIMLKAWVDVVLWVENVNPEQLHYIKKPEEICSAEYDYILLAYSNKKMVDKTIQYLHSIGVPDEKIIYDLESLGGK